MSKDDMPCLVGFCRAHRHFSLIQVSPWPEFIYIFADKHDVVMIAAPGNDSEYTQRVWLDIPFENRPSTCINSVIRGLMLDSPCQRLLGCVCSCFDIRV